MNKFYTLFPYILATQGHTQSIHDGGSDIFFWVENLHAWYFFGSRDRSYVFLGLKNIHIFFGSHLSVNVEHLNV